jgi:hypothetical protein
VPGLRWGDTLATQIGGPLRHPYLQFARKDRSWYDLDNLTYPVLAVLGTTACESVGATVEIGGGEGVFIRDQSPPKPPDQHLVMTYIARPNTASVADRQLPPELGGAEQVGGDDLLGLSLEFDAAHVAVGEMSYEGPVKSLIDDLAPFFGYRHGNGAPVAMDFRVKELRIARGHSPMRAGVRATIWSLADRE